MRDYLERGRRGLFAAGILAALSFGAAEAFADPVLPCSNEGQFYLGGLCSPDCQEVCRHNGYPYWNCSDGCCSCSY
jgi:hypothetical protein